VSRRATSPRRAGRSTILVSCSWTHSGCIGETRETRGSSETTAKRRFERGALTQRHGVFDDVCAGRSLTTRKSCIHTDPQHGPGGAETDARRAEIAHARRFMYSAIGSPSAAIEYVDDVSSSSASATDCTKFSAPRRATSWMFVETSAVPHRPPTRSPRARLRPGESSGNVMSRGGG